MPEDKESVLYALQLCEQLLALANSNLAGSKRNACLILAGILLDSAYQIRNAAGRCIEDLEAEKRHGL